MHIYAEQSSRPPLSHGDSENHNLFFLYRMDASFHRNGEKLVRRDYLKSGCNGLLREKGGAHWFRLGKLRRPTSLGLSSSVGLLFI